MLVGSIRILPKHTHWKDQIGASKTGAGIDVGYVKSQNKLKDRTHVDQNLVHHLCRIVYRPHSMELLLESISISCTLSIWDSPLVV